MKFKIKATSVLLAMACSTAIFANQAMNTTHESGGSHHAKDFMQIVDYHVNLPMKYSVSQFPFDNDNPYTYAVVFFNTLHDHSNSLHDTAVYFSRKNTMQWIAHVFIDNREVAGTLLTFTEDHVINDDSIPMEGFFAVRWHGKGGSAEFTYFDFSELSLSGDHYFSRHPVDVIEIEDDPSNILKHIGANHRG